MKDADIGHFTFHALRHTFATRALERGMDYKTLSAILGHYSVAFTMDTYVHSMDEHKRREMDKMDDMFGMPGHTDSAKGRKIGVRTVKIRRAAGQAL